MLGILPLGLVYHELKNQHHQTSCLWDSILHSYRPMLNAHAERKGQNVCAAPLFLFFFFFFFPLTLLKAALPKPELLQTSNVF